MSQVIVEKDFDKVMEDSYEGYALSVVLGRAFPAIEDGLKPVTRRIAYTFATEAADKVYKKGNYFVGLCIGKYHPHGDLSLYESIVMLSQSFFVPNPIVDNQGNNGSLTDPYSYAAQRYVEFRMSAFGREVLFSDFSESTNDMKPTSDKSLLEPVYLPAKIPMILSIGNTGIGAGYTVDIPTHNLKELCEATIHKLKNPEATTSEIMKYLKGPDYSTAGFVTNQADLPSIYEKGNGVIHLKGIIEEITHQGRPAIAIKEIPATTNLGKILDQLATHCRPDEKTKLPGLFADYIQDVQNLGGGGKIHLVIIPKKDVNLQVLTNLLFENTDMKTIQKYNANVLMNGVFYNNVSLEFMLSNWIAFRKKTIRRILSHEISKKKEEEFVTNALIKAHGIIDEIIALLRKSKNNISDAKETLVTKYGFADKEAEFIVKQRLYQISGLEIKDLKEKLKNIKEDIDNIVAILTDDNRISSIMSDEISSIAKKFGKPRSTQLINTASKVNMVDLIEEKNLFVAVTTDGYIYSKAISDIKSSNKGIQGYNFSEMKKGKVIDKVFIINNHTKLYCFSSQGKLFILNAYQLEVNNVHINNIIGGLAGDNIVSFLNIDESKDGSIVLITEKSLIKRMEIANFTEARSIRTTGLIAANVNDGDQVIDAIQSTDDNDIILVGTSRGYLSKVRVSNIALSARPSKGRALIKIKPEEKIVSLNFVSSKEEENSLLLLITEKGTGKLTPISELLFKRKEKGAGAAHLAIKVSEGDKLLKNQIVHTNEQIIVNTKLGKVIKIQSEDIRTIGRTAKGSRIIKITEGDKVSSINVVPIDE